MEKVTVIFERNDNNYAAYVDGLDGFVCTGATFEELKKEVHEGILFHLEGLKKHDCEVPSQFSGKYELVFKWEINSLLWYYNHVITRSALSKLTGINERQLGNYATGRSKPRAAQVQKIEAAFHKLGKELQSVNL